MFDLSLLPDAGLGWLDASGEQSDIVLSTRVRLARNVEGYAFTGRSREGERIRNLSQVRDAVPTVPSLANGVMVRVDELDTDDRRLLHERHVISRELAGLESSSGARGGAAVYVGEGVGVMINEEDHLRLQAVSTRGGVVEAGV
jgi:protein arginine kinase